MTLKEYTLLKKLTFMHAACRFNPVDGVKTSRQLGSSWVQNSHLISRLQSTQTTCE